MKKSKTLSLVILMTALINIFPASSQKIDDRSIYIYEEGDVVDTAKLEIIKAERIQLLKQKNAERLELLSKENIILAKLVEKKNAKFVA